MKMVYALSRMTRMPDRPLVSKLFGSSFHTHRRSSNHLLLLGKTSVSNCYYSFRLCGFWRLMAMRKAGSQFSSALLKDHVACNKRISEWDLRSPPPMPFDICQGRNVLQNTSEEEEDEGGGGGGGSGKYQPGDLRFLRPGMVLLKRFLTQDIQVSIVRECRRLGLGPGGFYWPQMRLMLMCLGLDWDPHTRKYNKSRRFDYSRAPDIPHGFLATVKRAMDAVQALTKKHRAANVEDILPMLSPDICIVNFYTTQGRLGLHQDRDESRGSLAKGLPIVSFSVGDSAEFFYGDVRDIRKAKKVVLESGDVVIFGGPSRHIFHGVQSIIPRTAPDFLLEETDLLPGRLNLTFRQF